MPLVALAQHHRSSDPPGSPGFSQGEIHDPFSSRYNSLTPAGSAWNSGFGSFSSGFSTGTSTFVYSQAYPLYPAFVPYGSFVGPYYPYGYPAYPPGWGPVFVPPFFVRAPAMYGPAAMEQFFPMPNNFPNNPTQQIAPARPQNTPPANGFGVLAPGAVADPPRAKVRASNADGRARSQRYIVLGDGYFSKQSFSAAYQRYRSAVQSAPDMADGYLREAVVLYALGRYESAVKALRRGLELDPDWPTKGFRLDTLYTDNAVAKTAHLEALAQAAARGPSEDLLFLLGVMLFCDGQKDRSRPFFERARELAGANADTEYLAGFTRQLAPRMAPVAAPRGGANRPTDKKKPGVDL